MIKVISSFLILVLLSSCGNNSSKIIEEKESIVSLESIQDVEPSQIVTGNEIYPLYSKGKIDTNELSINYAYYSLLNNGKCSELYQDSVNQIIADFVDAVSNMSQERIRASFSTDIFKESLPIFASFYNELNNENDSTNYMLWDVKSEISINDSFPGFVELTTSSWCYTGGTHGNGFIIYSLLSKKDGHDMKLNEFCSDLIKLNQLAAKKLREDRGLSSNQSLADEGFWIENESDFLNENFYFNNGDLFFIFNQYEIASYADGQIEIHISKSELEGIIKE